MTLEDIRRFVSIGLRNPLFGWAGSLAFGNFYKGDLGKVATMKPMFSDDQPTRFVFEAAKPMSSKAEFARVVAAACALQRPGKATLQRVQIVQSSPPGPVYNPKSN